MIKGDFQVNSQWIDKTAVIMLPECFLGSLAQGQTVIALVWNAESPACRLLAKVAFVAVLCLGDTGPQSIPTLHSHVYPKSVSVAALGGAQWGAPRADYWAVRGFLLLSLLLFPPALRGPSLHSQVVDPVGLGVGDFAEGHFVDGGVFRRDQQEEQRGEAEGPGAHWQPELGGDRTDTQVHLGTALWSLCLCLPVAKSLRLGSWAGLDFPEDIVATKCRFSCPYRGLSVFHLESVGLHKASDTAGPSPVRGAASILGLNATWHHHWSNWIMFQSSDGCNESQDTPLTCRHVNCLIKGLNSTLSDL